MKEVTFLTEHAQVLLCISAHPEWTVRQLAKELETSDRQIFRLLNDLQRAGFLTREGGAQKPLRIEGRRAAAGSTYGRRDPCRAADPGGAAGGGR